jgi:hypothetical protein
LICTIISIILILVIEDSTWIPCGNSMWNGGIHMESTWNIGGRKSPKWVRSQPKHIPCGMGRFHVEPHGFHMDSMWNKGAG